MCGRYAQYAPIKLSDVMLATLADLDSEFDFAAEMAGVDPAYNTAPTQSAAVLAVRDDRLVLRRLRWAAHWWVDRDQSFRAQDEQYSPQSGVTLAVASDDTTVLTQAAMAVLRAIATNPAIGT